jgi:hypothetical protein
MTKFILYSLILSFTISCQLFKKTTDSDGVILNAKIDDFTKYRDNANYNIVNAFIDENVLNVDVTYSGGCKLHSFELIGSQFLTNTMPPERVVLLVHHNNGDDCRELMGERLKFNIKNLGIEGKEITLKLKGYQNGLMYQMNN